MILKKWSAASIYFNCDVIRCLVVLFFLLLSEYFYEGKRKVFQAFLFTLRAPIFSRAFLLTYTIPPKCLPAKFQATFRNTAVSMV